ncbi:cell wall protein DAN4-like [Penaeus monodon]|uniref:cell wall protein DAN4-like n=1 Tax=Penaeus monodon TaxID=6687 RepID=UPI0018A70E4A|nr:cell wall protein DAN4-like [Penaeus monodon]
MKLLLALVLVGAVSAVPEEDHFVNPVMPGLAVRGGTTFLFSSTATVTRTIETQITTLATCVAAASNLPTCSARAEARFFAFVPTANEQRYELQPEARAVDHLEPSFESGQVIDHGRIIEFLPPIGLLTVVTNTAWEIMVTATVSHPTETVTISLAGCVPQILPFSVAACVATGTSTTNTATTTTSGTTTTGTSTTPTTTTSATTTTSTAPTTTPVVSSTSTTSTTPTATTTTTPASTTTSVTTSSTPPMSPTVVATVTSTVTRQ